MKIKLIFVFLIFLAACSGSTPKDVLPRDKMQKVLWDVTLAGEYANGYIFSKYYDLNRAAVNNELLEKVFKSNGITKKQFEKSLDYYRDHPQKLMTVLDSLYAQQKRIDDARNEKTEKNKEIEEVNASILPPPVNPPPVQ